MKDEPKRARSPEIRFDGAGIEVFPRPAALVAKASLLEAVGREVLDSRDMRAISERALDYLGRYIRAETSLFLIKRQDNLVVLAARGPLAERLTGSEFRLEGSLAAVLGADAGATINMPNLAVDVALGFKDGLTGRLTEYGVMSFVLTRVGQTGAMALASERLDAFTKFDESAVEGVAFQLAYIAENIRQHRFLQQTADELDKLLDSLNRVHASVDLNETLQTTLSSAVELSGADSGSFLLFNEALEHLSLEAAIGLPEAATAVEIKVGEGISGWVAKNRKPVIVKDLDGGEAARTGFGPVKVAAALALPVLLGDRLVGVLNLGSTRVGHDFAAGGLSQLVRLLGQTGAAIVAGQANEEWQTLYFDTVKALAQVVESRDPFTRGHAAEVSKYAGALAKALRLTDPEVETVELAGLLHDIGAAGVSDTVFRQDRPLNSVELLMIRSHPRLGTKALSEITRFRGLLPIVLYHHENFDGSGYAEGLKGDQIPLGARILALAEAYSAMTAERSYRPAKSPAEAIDELRRGAGTQFDPQLVYIFCNLLERSLSGPA